MQPGLLLFEALQAFGERGFGVGGFLADLVIGWFKAMPFVSDSSVFQKNSFAAVERRLSLASSGNMFFVWRERCFHVFPTAHHQSFSSKNREAGSGRRAERSVQTQYALLCNAACQMRELCDSAEMAIAFARARYISRSTGGSAARSAAYNARAEIGDERTGEVFYFKHRDAPEHHEVLLPDGADEKFGDAATLWNAAEAAERRKDSQVAREIVMALPANAEVSNEDRIELARSFAQEHFVAKGLGVQLDIHAPHGGDLESERANWHAHLLITTRRIEGDRLSATKARDLAPDIRQAGARSFVAEGEEWGKLWREHQDRYFLAHGINARVDATATHAQEHIGPLRMRAAESEANERAKEIARANAEAARDPSKVLEALTRNNATFSERDLDRYLAKHIFDETERRSVHGRVLGHDETLPLHERETGEASGRFTTRTVRAEEREALQEARALADARHHKSAPESAKARALAGKSLRDDQRTAFDHATGEGGIKIIEGRAGTGKSFTLAAIRDAHQEQGRSVIGLAPTNSVAEDLKADGFARASTVHAELFRLKNGRAIWDKSTRRHRRRGGDARYARNARAFGRGAAQRRQAHSCRRRSSAGVDRTRRAVFGIEAAARLG